MSYLKTKASWGRLGGTLAVMARYGGAQEHERKKHLGLVDGVHCPATLCTGAPSCQVLRAVLEQQEIYHNKKDIKLLECLKA